MNARDQQRIDVLARWREGGLTIVEASALLGVSQRTAWRLRRRFIGLGADGIVHGNRGRPSPRRLPEATRERIAELARTRYRGVNDSHLAELLVEDEEIVIGRSSLQRLLRRAGLGTTRTRRAPKYRSRRERMPQAGLLVQVDGSPHDWLGGRGPRLTLVGAIDDATGAIVAATFAPVEDGRAYLTILAGMCRDHGVPAAIYRDRSSIFAPSHPGGPLGDAGAQVGRALAELGIASIAAASPQAKGRVERLWGTCQDRLVSELRLAGADDLETANVVLERFVGRFNARFSVVAANPTPAWRTAPPARELDRICAFRWPRVVGNDNTVRVEGAILQLPPSLGGRGVAGRRVVVELRLDGRLLVVDRGRTLLVVPVSADLRELRGVRLLAEHGPRVAPGGAERAGYKPRADHPWSRPGPKAPRRPPVTESLSR
ncbi:MAG: ISNCY family transposase [Candidatus Limnocylindrales bacterium]